MYYLLKIKALAKTDTVLNKALENSTFNSIINTNTGIILKKIQFCLID